MHLIIIIIIIIIISSSNIIIIIIIIIAHTQVITCFHSINLRDFRMAQIMIFAIEEINRSESLLPNVSIGYRIYDTCGSRLSSMSATMALMNGHDIAAGDTCNRQSSIHAIIGETESSATVILSRSTGPFKIPVVRSNNGKSLTITILMTYCFTVLSFLDKSLGHM